MSSSNHLKCRRSKDVLWENTALSVLIVAVGILSGCGGYRAPAGGTMPGQTPRTYPMQHRTSGSGGGSLPSGSGLVLPE
jgi:hypothetical protein